MAFSVCAQRLVEVGKGFSSTSVNTTVFRNNSIVTHGNTQYISYYDAEGWLMLGKRRLGTGEWILHRTQYKGHVKDAHNIISMMVDGDGYLHLSFDHHGHKLNYCRSHLSWVWRETWHVETNHDLCYARSFDGGRTWYKTNGQKYELPIRLGNAEYACRIPQNAELINQTSMSTDAGGHPYIATYWRNPDSDVPQYRIVWHDGVNWHNRQVSERKTPFSLKGGGTKMIPMSRPRMVVDNGEVYYLFRDQERGSKVSMYYTKDIQFGEWHVKDLTDFAVNAWEPSHDTELWKMKKQLHIYVQDTRQGDGEKQVETEPQMVYVLEL